MDILSDIIYPAIDDLTQQAGAPQALQKSPDAPLFGPGSPLDSLSLVAFLIAVENQILDRAGISVALATDTAMSRARSPFRSMATLQDYVRELLIDQGVNV